METEFKGALVYKTGDHQTVQPGIPGIAPITFDKVLYDTCGYWNAESNRFVIPAGVRFVRLKAQAIFQYGAQPSAAGIRQIVIKKNFNTLEDWYSDRPGWAAGQVPTHIATTVDVSASGPVLPVIEGDTFLVDAFVWDGVEQSEPVKILGINGTWFSIEVVHAATKTTDQYPVFPDDVEREWERQNKGQDVSVMENPRKISSAVPEPPTQTLTT